MNPTEKKVIFYEFDTKQKKMVETKNTIGKLTPLTPSSATNSSDGWLRVENKSAPLCHENKFSNIREDAQKQGFGGKWIIRMPKNAPDIIKIWKKVQEGVKSGVFTEGKVSLPTENFDEQVILVYTLDWQAKNDVEFRLKEMQRVGIISADANIEYKKESDTLHESNKVTYTSKELLNNVTSPIGLKTSSNSDSSKADRYLFNAKRIIGAIPLFGIFTGILHIYDGFKGKLDANLISRGLRILRGVTEICGLGFLFLIADLFKTYRT